MTRVHVMVEGQTEETFVRDVLYDHLHRRGVFLNPILLRTSAQGKGGVVIYGKVRWQVSRQCLSDVTAKVTTMIDLFRLPNDFIIDPSQLNGDPRPCSTSSTLTT